MSCILVICKNPYKISSRRKSNNLASRFHFDRLRFQLLLTMAAMPPTKILFGMRVPYLGGCVGMPGVPAGVKEEPGEISPDELCKTLGQQKLLFHPLDQTRHWTNIHAMYFTVWWSWLCSFCTFRINRGSRKPHPHHTWRIKPPPPTPASGVYPPLAMMASGSGQLFLFCHNPRRRNNRNITSKTSGCYLQMNCTDTGALISSQAAAVSCPYMYSKWNINHQETRWYKSGLSAWKVRYDWSPEPCKALWLASPWKLQRKKLNYVSQREDLAYLGYQ